MVRRELADFDLGQLARSGQCFRLRAGADGRYTLIASGRLLTMTQQGQTVTFDCGEDEFEQVWRPYFDLDADYGSYKRAVPADDAYLQSAVRVGGGIRILRQELWETIACFILSTRNNIPRIMQCVDGLCERFGAPCQSADGRGYRAFPTAERLAACTPDDLAPVRLGYRAKYIAAAARQVAAGDVDLEAVRRLPYPQAKGELMRLTGVGVKVAECVCLFALHHIDAFPVDTHIRQMLDAHYPGGFPLKRYRGFAGVMQQYAFFYELMKQ